MFKENTDHDYLEKKMNKMKDDITKINSLQTEIQEDISKMKEGLEKLIKSLSK